MDLKQKIKEICTKFEAGGAYSLTFIDMCELVAELQGKKVVVAELEDVVLVVKRKDAKTLSSILYGIWETTYKPHTPKSVLDQLKAQLKEV